MKQRIESKTTTKQLLPEVLNPALVFGPEAVVGLSVVDVDVGLMTSISSFDQGVQGSLTFGGSLDLSWSSSLML